MRRGKRIAAVVLLITLAALPAISVDVNNSPGWLILEKGKQLFDAENYGNAMFHFRKANEALGAAPEVEYWIGRVFEAEGEYELAAEQYVGAVQKKQMLLVPGEELVIRRRLAEVYFTLGNFAGYSNELETIIRYDASAREQGADIIFEPRVIARVLTQRGINKLLELYRIDDWGGLAAYYDLGIYKYRTGFFEAAIEHLAFAFTITQTTIIEHLISRDPEYRFTTLQELFIDALKVDIIVDYAYSVNAFGQMYALAASLYESGDIIKRELARELWRFVAEYDQRSWWSDRAVRQLESPFSDDFMIIFPE